MLRKPGEYDPSRSATTTSRAYSSTRRKTAEENPDDVVRKLQRLPGNKKCADCSAKLPQATNLTHGTFVCLTCSGVHREFYHRIKGVGHSAFTSEEVSFLSQHGNDVVNAKYLKNYNPTLEVLKPPDGSAVDEQFLRVWLRRKYVDKAWVSKDEATPSQSNGSQESRRTLQPTRAQIPPKSGSKPVASAPTADLLGGFIETVVPTSETACAPTISTIPQQKEQVQTQKQTFDDDAWDAFGKQRESCPVSSSFQADFHFPQLSKTSHEQMGGDQSALQPASTFEADFSQFRTNNGSTQPQSLWNVTMNGGDEMKVESALNHATSNIHTETLNNDGTKPSVDPFDAFDNLHISHPGGDSNHDQKSPLDLNNGVDNQVVSSQIKYEVGQKLQYRDSQQNISLVEVVKVHLDQDLVPFYDIKMENGWEKQTDNNHLSIAPQTLGGDVHQTGMMKESGKGDSWWDKGL